MRALCFCICLLAVSLRGLASPARADETLPCSGLKPGPRLTVARVIDAETLLLHDGSHLRLAGILAPRAEDARAGADKWPSAVAARAELEALVLGRSIEIVAAGEDRDRYGRHVGHGLLLAGGPDGARLWLQGHLLTQGLVRGFTSSQNRACAREILAAEAIARAGRRGIWAEEAYRVREAAAPEALLALRGTFQIVEGRVAKAVRTRGFLRLAFFEGRRFGFTAGVPAPRTGGGAFSGLARMPDAAELQGRRIRVRGWLDERGGSPTMDLALAGDVEVLDAAAEK